MALLVFGNLRIRVGRRVAHNDRHLKQSRSYRCSQPLGPEVNSMSSIGVGRMNNDWLQDAMLQNVFSEFFYFGFRDFGARIVRADVEPCRRNDQGLSRRGARRDLQWTRGTADDSICSGVGAQQIELKVV